MDTKMSVGMLGVLSVLAMGLGSAWAEERTAPQPKPADMTRPVKVFVLLGQSNMVGMGNISGDKGESLEKAVKTEKLYPYLVDRTGNWAERNDVRNVQVMVGRDGGMDILHNEWLKVGEGKGRGKGKMGIEYALGHELGEAMDEPIMLLKSCIGNRSLGWALLPPGSERFEAEVTDRTSTLLMRSSFWPPSAKPPRAARATPTLSCRPSSRWMARAASTPSTRAMSPPSTPTAWPAAAVATATTAATPRCTWTSAKPWEK